MSNINIYFILFFIPLRCLEIPKLIMLGGNDRADSDRLLKHQGILDVECRTLGVCFNH